MPPTDEQIRVNNESSPDDLRRAAEQRELQMRTVQKYPGWRFHKTHPAVIVNSPEEEKALGAGWSEEQDPNNTATRGRASVEELRALAAETERLAERTAEVAGVQSPNDRARAESTNLLREATGARGAGSADERTEALRQQGEEANRRATEEHEEARKSARYNEEEARKLAANVEGHPDSYRARKAAKKGTAKKSAAKKAAPPKTAAKKGKLGGTRK